MTGMEMHCAAVTHFSIFHKRRENKARYAASVHFPELWEPNIISFSQLLWHISQIPTSCSTHQKKKLFL